MSELLPALAPDAPALPSVIAEIVRMPSALEAAQAFAEASAALESRLALSPDDYAALAALGELWLRAGRVFEARELLQRAILLPPPSWAVYQRTSAMLRRAEALSAKAFARPTLGPLRGPSWLAALAVKLSASRRGSA